VKDLSILSESELSVLAGKQAHPKHTLDEFDRSVSELRTVLVPFRSPLCQCHVFLRR
jgi:hypothetical protein